MRISSRYRSCCRWRNLKELDRQTRELEEQIVDWHERSEPSRRLAKIPGIGPITASALVASISDVRSFKSGRELAAWVGLVPRQHSSGGKPTLLGISKRGDRYLRTLLVHGARSVIVRACQRSDDKAAGSRSCWNGDTSISPRWH